MNPRRVTSWTLSTSSLGTIPQIFVGDLIEAEQWAEVVNGDASWRLIGADGQRSEFTKDLRFDEPRLQ